MTRLPAEAEYALDKTLTRWRVTAAEHRHAATHTNGDAARILLDRAYELDSLIDAVCSTLQIHKTCAVHMIDCETCYDISLVTGRLSQGAENAMTFVQLLAELGFTEEDLNQDPDDGHQAT